MSKLIKAAVGAVIFFSSDMYANAQANNPPGYFIPPAMQLAQNGGSSGAVISAHPIGQASPVIDGNLVDTLPPPTALSYNAPLPWYETDWGVAGIGVVATGVTLVFDHGINQYTQTKLSLRFRKDVALKVADALEIAPLAFAGVTMVQSPISDPQLAHASSIAMTSAAAVTVEVMALKYVVGRDRPGGPNSNPFVAQPFDAANSSFSLGAVLPGEGGRTSSFPSGHTALAFALITPYAELYHAPVLYAIPVAVGLGRIAAVDGHWASDVVGGGFIGWLTADITRRLFPDSDFGMMLFGDGQSMMVGVHGQF
jgi:membrane-associated phospholipid phosphatase